ncbi:SOS response-associated peptidase [Streptomyces sp. NPDC048606]|uniref:SOS response-associated peptidase n=1 Tax=Streptomyces sp. NPDC048606 TaxID=3154726 RepID=UPI003442F007
MCGRYVSTRSPEDLTDLFGVTARGADPVVPPSWNVAPTDPVWAVLERADRETGVLERRLRALRWGLVPSWSKTAAGGAKMINARVETVAEKPAYRRAFAARRCLLPADGFYEWEAVPATATAKAYKRPWFIRPRDGSVMAMAGLYEFWRDPAVEDDQDPAAWWATCTVLTTEARDEAGRVHPRMPLALAPADYDAWLDPAGTDAHDLRALLTTPAGGRLEVRAVTTAVNNVRNNGPELLEAAADA